MFPIDDDDGNAKPAVIAQPQDHIVEIWSKAAIGEFHETFSHSR